VDGFMCVPPIDNDGTLAPSGTPGMYIAFNDDALGGGTDQLWLYELSIDWTTPANSTFNRTQQLDVDPFNADFGPNWNNIPQKGVGQKVDGIPQVIMNVPQYRNFGSYQTIVCCHTVNVDGNGLAGIRWYELRKSGSGLWSVRQQGTYAPDNNCRWMGSIMLNAHNKIGLGYSISSTEMYPSIRFCGQSPANYNNATGQMDIAEDTIWNGSNSQTGANRWGDYSLLSVDPSDDETFWFTDEYIGSGGSRKTRIASFKFITGPSVTTETATDITSLSATLNGTINPQGLETDYHFEYGTIPFNLSNSTPTVSIGSGTTIQTVSADINGLLKNKKYYFRLVGVNSAGLIAGSILNFVTGNSALLNVTPLNQNVQPPADSVQFTVTSNVTWIVTCSDPWCTVTPASGSGNGVITAKFTENTLASQRVASITVAADSLAPVVVTVTQEGVAPVLNITPPNRDVSSPSGTTTFTVTANVDWVASSDTSWCTVTSSGSGNGTITANFTENLSTEPRVAQIAVSGTGAGMATATVTQAGAAPILSVTPPSRDVTATAAGTTFTVVSNTSWTVTSDSPWCTVTASGNGNGTINADYQGNSTSASRTATISVTVASLPVQQVTVNQAKTAVGIDDHSGNGIKIYPNPSRGIFTISIPASRKAIDVTVHDLAGVTILKQEFSGMNEYTLDLSAFGAGSYPVMIRTENTMIVRKLVIIR
jgi:hypothetical protein